MSLHVTHLHGPAADQADSSSVSVRPITIQFGVDDSGRRGYEPGGYEIVPAQYGFTTKVLALILSAASTSNGNFWFVQDPQSGWLRAFSIADTVWTEAPAGTDFGDIQLHGLAFGV